MRIVHVILKILVSSGNEFEILKEKIDELKSGEDQPSPGNEIAKLELRLEKACSNLELLFKGDHFCYKHLFFIQQFLLLILRFFMFNILI
jgi:hypothetical protein